MGGTDSRLLVPSKDMIIRGYVELDRLRIIGIRHIGITYLPEGAFMEFSNITVKFAQFDSALQINFYNTPNKPAVFLAQILKETSHMTNWVHYYMKVE